MKVRWFDLLFLAMLITLAYFSARIAVVPAVVAPTPSDEPRAVATYLRDKAFYERQAHWEPIPNAVVSGEIRTPPP
jgi:hypothetical protein